jgi:hypothetical protein
MILAAIVFSACQAAVLVCFALLCRRWYNSELSRIRDEISSTLAAFVSSPDADTPSPLAVIVDQAALLLAARLMQQLKAMMAGVESGESKGEQDLMIQAASAQSPWLALIAGMLPKRIRNQLLKNPQMIGALSKIGGNHQAEPAQGAQKSFEL